MSDLDQWHVSWALIPRSAFDLPGVLCSRPQFRTWKIYAFATDAAAAGIEYRPQHVVVPAFGRWEVLPRPALRLLFHFAYSAGTTVGGSDAAGAALS